MLLQYNTSIATPKGLMNFNGSDSEDLYKTNLQKLPSDWKYRTEHITYAFNSNGYRAPEWDSIDWQESIVVLGCSNVFGTGLSNEDTIPFQLQEILKRPVINLGMSGTGADYQYWNLVRLFQNNIKVKKILVLWPHPARFMYFKKPGIVDSVQVKNLDLEDVTIKSKNRQLVEDYLLNLSHWYHNFEQTVNAANMLYPDIVNYYYNGVFKHYDLKLPGYDSTHKGIMDPNIYKDPMNYNIMSRDGEHFGTDLIKNITIPHILSRLDI